MNKLNLLGNCTKKTPIPGIYILDFNTHIKIGRSKNITTRV